MAKELPYFKFEPNQWENGNIQMFSREDKGLFIDLCSMYWSRLGDVPLKLAIQKLCAGNATAFDSLIKEGIFTVENDFVCIDFLNEQLSDFEDTSKQNSKNAKERWEKYRKLKAESERNATALNPQCENDAIREEEIKEDKKRRDKVFVPPQLFEVENYFFENGYTKESGKKAFNYYAVADWKDSKGTKVRNWKQKMQAVWFKEENKIKKTFIDSPY
jgi:hypothetical protein